jgi:hypothetical protein
MFPANSMNYYYYYYCGGVSPSPSVIRPEVVPLHQPRMMNERGLITARRTKKCCPSVALVTTNPIWAILGLKLGPPDAQYSLRFASSFTIGQCEPIINDVHRDGEGGRLKIQE